MLVKLTRMFYCSVSVQRPDIKYGEVACDYEDCTVRTDDGVTTDLNNKRGDAEGDNNVILKQHYENILPQNKKRQDHFDGTVTCDREASVSPTM